MINIFISYGHDKYADLAKKLRDRIAAVEENGEKKFDVFLDDKLALGKNWRWELGERIENTDYMICFLTEHSVRKDSVCLEEIGFALESDKTIIPVRLEDIKVPFGIRGLHRVEWLNNPDGFDDKFNEILNAISVPLREEKAEAQSGCQRLLLGAAGQALCGCEAAEDRGIPPVYPRSRRQHGALHGLSRCRSETGRILGAQRFGLASGAVRHGHLRSLGRLFVLRIIQL